MGSRRNAGLTAVALVALLLPGWAGLAYARSDIKVAGFVDVLPIGPGGTLTLPLPPDAGPVDVEISVGNPSVPILVRITPTTVIKAESGLPVTIIDGDRVKAEGALVAGALEAVRLEVEHYSEAELIGTAKGLPGPGVTLPLLPGKTLDFHVSLGSSGGEIPVRVTSDTKLEGGPVTLVNGAIVQVEAILKNFRFVVTEIAVGGAEPEPGDDNG